LSTLVVNSALALYTQAGRVIYDLTQGVYRLRELAREPLPLDLLRFASPLEEQASKLLAVRGLSRESAESQPGGGVRLSARVKDGERNYDVSLRLDADQRIAEGSCQCNHYNQNRLRLGPCAHMLALRMSQSQKAVA
jgi:hypothetical protein